MKAKIVKTVNIGDVPGESRRMIDIAKNQLMYLMPDKMSEIVKYSLSSNAEEYFHAIALIENFRQELKDFDGTLQEIHNVMSGYKEYVIGMAQKQNEISQQKMQEEQIVQGVEEDNSEKAAKRAAGDQEIKERIDNFVKQKREQQVDQAAVEQAEYEKRMARTADVEEGFDEEG